MSSHLKFSATPTHQALLEEYCGLECDETRLEWLIERRSLHEKLPAHALTQEKRVPGCLSGLWLYSTVEQGLSQFSSFSESAMVQGITSFLCDLHSNRSPADILSIHNQLAQHLGLDRLLSMNRKRAVVSVMNFINFEADRHLHIIDPTPTSEAV